MHDTLLNKKFGITDKTLEVARFLIYTYRSDEKVTLDELIAQAKKLIGLASESPNCAPFSKQMAKWLYRIELGSNNAADAAAAATSMGALADALFEQKLINEQERDATKHICWRLRVGE
jgi:hypothetical protein